MKSDKLSDGYCKTKTNLGGSVAGRTRRRTRVTVSGAEVQYRSLSPVLQTTFYEPPDQILGAAELVDRAALTSFLGNCQFKFGGIAKAPGEHAGRDLTSLR